MISHLNAFFYFLFCFSGPDSPYTKTALEIVNVCKQTLAEVLLCEKEGVLCCFVCSVWLCV